MTPVILQKRGAVHLADEDESAAAGILLAGPKSKLLNLIPDKSVLDPRSRSAGRPTTASGSTSRHSRRWASI